MPENKTESPFDMVAVRVPAPPTQIALHKVKGVETVIGTANE
jgi:hypothetical protein